MSSRSFPVILSIVLSLGTLSFYLSEGSSINQVRPACFLRGWPPRTSLLLGYPIPSLPAKDKVVYHGHYCYSEKKTRWCHKPPLSYKSFDNCTSEQLTDGVKVKCNMTEFLKKLYPNYWDSSLSNQLGNTVCMVISATNKKYTNFTRKKCCKLRGSYKFSPIEILSLTTPAKGQINITWRSPSDMDDSTKGFTEYIFYLSMIDTDINQTIKVFPSKPKASIFFHIIEDLQPYTKYRLTGAVFFENQNIGIQSKPMEVRTLPEAPSAPPIIVENQVMSQSETTRTVAVKWMHPEKQKRNGIIMQTVMEYEKQTDNINETLTYYVKRIVNGNWTNATITDLIKDADYILTLQSCTTAVDCSIRSQQITLKGIGTMDQQPSRRSSHFTSSTVFIVIIVVVISVLCFGFLLYLVCYFKRRNRREDAVAEFPSLDPLQEDITVLPDDQTPDIEERCPDANNTNYSELQQLNPEKIAGHDQAAILQADDSAYMCLVSNSNKESQEEIPLC